MRLKSKANGIFPQRDQEHRESLASTLRNLRTDATRQTTAIEKLQTRNEDLSRQLSLAQSQERSARAALRTAESSARSLREEMLRLKTTVTQVRTSCANDIRKRDVQIQRLKSHLTGQQRGNKTGLVGASITINPGNIESNGNATAREDVLDVDDPEYSLRQETTEFLTQLSQNLSDENDNLIGLVRSTLATLRELQGLPENRAQEEGGGMGTIGEDEDNTEQGMMHGLPSSYETLATDMDTVLENLKTLLTNPNFVSVEEVEMREEEIAKLRAGWDRMETRWRDTLSLMEGWRKRMANGGDTINLEDITKGLGLSGGLDTINTAEMSVITEDDDDEGVSSALDEDIDNEAKLEEPPSPEPDDVPEKTAASDMFDLKLQPAQPALRERNSNIRSPRKVAFSASIPNTPSEAGNENVKEDGSEADVSSAIKRTRKTAEAKASPLEEHTSRAAAQDSRIPRQVRCDDSTTTDLDIDQVQAKKRSSDHAHPDERSPKLSVEDKLRVAETAAAAAVAEGLNPVKSGGLKKGGEDGDRRQRHRGSPMKTRIAGRPKRRKSTLTPEELQNLLGFE